MIVYLQGKGYYLENWISRYKAALSSHKIKIKVSETAFKTMTWESLIKI